MKNDYEIISAIKVSKIKSSIIDFIVYFMIAYILIKFGKELFNHRPIKAENYILVILCSFSLFAMSLELFDKENTIYYKYFSLFLTIQIFAYFAGNIFVRFFLYFILFYFIFEKNKYNKQPNKKIVFFNGLPVTIYLLMALLFFMLSNIQIMFKYFFVFFSLVFIYELIYFFKNDRKRVIKAATKGLIYFFIIVVIVTILTILYKTNSQFLQLIFFTFLYLVYYLKENLTDFFSNEEISEKDRKHEIFIYALISIIVILILMIALLSGTAPKPYWFKLLHK